MTMRTVHAHVRDRKLVIDEEIDLPDGSSVVLMFDVAEKAPPGESEQGAKAVVTFDTYDLGTFLPLTRSKIYEDVG